MSGIRHSLPFHHYHRKEDGTTYFVVNGEINAAPTGQETIEVGSGYQRCSFDMEAALTIKDWESPSEFEPFRREVEQALGLPITLNALEKVRDAINGMLTEWKADYDYPGFLAVFPRAGNAMDDDKVCWSWGTANGPWGGDDRTGDESVHWADMPENADPVKVAYAIVKHMRGQALKRVGWLHDFINSCVSHIEQTSGTSPESVVGPWAGSKGAQAYDEARAIIATWRGGRA